MKKILLLMLLIISPVMASRQFTRDFYLEVAKGNIAGHSLVHKFGRNEAVGATYEPVCMGGVYQTPQPASATTLRVKAGGDAQDAQDDDGARSIRLQGLDETGTLQEETITTHATDGTLAGDAGLITFVRLFRAYVLTSGVYAGPLVASHKDDIVIEASGGGADWATISATTIARSQSEIASYAVPLGKTAYLVSFLITTDALKPVDFMFFKREEILDAAAPYTARRLQFEEIGLEGALPVKLSAPMKFDALTDIGFLARASSAADVSADFVLLLIDD